MIILQKTLPTHKATDLLKEFPIEFPGDKRTTGYVLLTLSSHLNYHLGQIKLPPEDGIKKPRTQFVCRAKNYSFTILKRIGPAWCVLFIYNYFLSE